MTGICRSINTTSNFFAVCRRSRRINGLLAIDNHVDMMTGFAECDASQAKRIDLIVFGEQDI
jgi:hypothetical protein